MSDLPAKGTRGRVGVLVMRSYLLAGNTAHYDGVLAALEARGLDVVPAFATGLDARPAMDKFFMQNGRVTVDAVVSLTGFSLVGGPAYNDAKAAEEMLAGLDVPYLAAHAVEFQSLEQWGASERGLMPIEQTIMVAIPELDGSTGPMVFGGRSDGTGEACTGCDRRCVLPKGDAERNMHVCIDRAEMLAARIEKLVALRRSQRAERKLAIVLFNFPPNSGATGSAAFLSVFASLFNTLKSLKEAGYSVEVPASVDALRNQIITGNAAAHGSIANVVAQDPGRYACPPPEVAEGNRRPVGCCSRPRAERWPVDLRARRAIWKCAGRDPAGVRLRGRPDAVAVREELRADACVCRLLPLSARRFRRARTCCTTARTVRWNSCRASRRACPVRRGRTG